MDLDPTAAKCTLSHVLQQAAQIVACFVSGCPNVTGTFFGSMTGCSVNTYLQTFVTNVHTHLFKIEQEFIASDEF